MFKIVDLVVQIRHWGVVFRVFRLLGRLLGSYAESLKGLLESIQMQAVTRKT